MFDAIRLPKVLMICADFPPALNGVGDHADRLSVELAGLGADVTILTTRTETASGRDTGVSVAGRHVSRSVDSWSMRTLSSILHEVDRLGPDLTVHIQYPGVAFGRQPMVNLLPLALRMLRPAVRVVVTVHEMRVMRRRWRARVAPMLVGAHTVIHVDAPDRDHLARLAPGTLRKLRCIPTANVVDPVSTDPADVARWRTELGLPGEEPVVAFFGIIYPHKGLLDLVEAIGQLRDQGTPARLLVIGGFDRGTEHRAEVEGAMARGRSEGWIAWQDSPPLERVSQCLRAATLAALPFHAGASSNRSSLLAALDHGLHVVTTRGPATPRDFAAEYDVDLVPPHDVDALAGAIGRFLNDGSQVRPVPTMRRPEVDWPEIARRTLDVYREAEVAA